MISRSLYHYRSVAADQTPLRNRIKEIAAARVRYGYKRIHVVLRREGWRINHKRVYRLYKQDGLSLFERRPRRHRSASQRLPPRATQAINECWAMDFVSDQLYDGRKLRALTLVDVHTRECLAIWVDQGIRGDDVVRTLGAVIASRGQPERIQVDNVLKAIGNQRHGKGIRYRGAEAPRRQQRASSVASSLPQQRQADRQRSHRSLQRPATAGVPEPALVLVIGRCTRED